MMLCDDPRGGSAELPHSSQLKDCVVDSVSDCSWASSAIEVEKAEPRASGLAQELQRSA